MNLDQTDLCLLADLQRDATARLEQLAERAGVSTATAQRRIRRLREAGVIRATVALLDGQQVGQPLTFVVLVELEREQSHHLDAFVATVRAEPLIQQCHYITGEADFCLICVAPDMAAFAALTQRLFHTDPNVKRFRTSTVLATRKAETALPLPDPRG